MWDTRKRWTMWTSSILCQTTSRFACGSTEFLNLRIAHCSVDFDDGTVVLFLAGEEEELRGELDTMDHWHC